MSERNPWGNHTIKGLYRTGRPDGIKFDKTWKRECRHEHCKKEFVTRNQNQKQCHECLSQEQKEKASRERAW